MGVGFQHHYYFRGGSVGLRVGLNWCGKSHPSRDSISGQSSPYCVAILTKTSSSLTYVSKRRTVSIFRAVYPENGGKRSLRNVGTYLQNYTASHIRRWNKNVVLLSKHKIMQYAYKQCNGDIGIYAVLVQYVMAVGSHLHAQNPLPSEYGFLYPVNIDGTRA